MGPIRAVELLIDKINKDYSNDVSLVLLMGSHVFGQAHSRSDIDMLFVRKTERAQNLAMAFIIDGIGYDFWAVSWEQLERFARREERNIVSILVDGKPLYFGGDDDRTRFEALRRIALDAGDLSKRVKLAERRLGGVYRHAFDVQRARTLADARYHSIGVIYALTDAIALRNGIPVRRGRGRLKGEILAMPMVPDGFSELYDTVFADSDSTEIQTACTALVSATERLIRAAKEEAEPPRAFVQALDWLYEELINSYNKIRHAAEIGDAVTALFAAVELTNEIESAFDRTGVSPDALPSLCAVYDPNDLASFARCADVHQGAFEALLAEKGVTVRRFADFDALAEHLETL